MLVDRLYDWLSQGPTPDCDRIFGAALVHAEPPWTDRIAQILLERGQEAAWAALVGRYSHLAADIRQRVRADSERLQAGIALAAKATDPATRDNALLALRDQPSPQMAYLLSDAIRDPAAKTRALAAEIFRRMAEIVLEPSSEPGRGDEGERRQLVLALEEALRTFDLHNRVEVLEVCLWFARDLGEALWQKLRSRRSRAAVAVSEQLPIWDNPRLAAFLVSALTRPAWRGAASQLLQSWRTTAQLTALLRESELLDDPRIRQQLMSVQSPRWFEEAGDELRQLAPEIRPLAPRWACHAGYREDEKMAMLSQWLQAPEPRLHQATVYALAELRNRRAQTLLKQVAASDSPLASFARSCIVDSGAEPPPPAAPRRDDAPAVAESSPSADSSPPEDANADDFDALWRVCRQTGPRDRNELVATLRASADIWQPQLESRLRSADPRDRVLALQVISTAELAPRFQRDLDPLLTDPVQGIRQLAQMLKSTLSQTGPPPSPYRGRVSPAPEEREPARRELQTVLEQLSAGTAQPTDAELMGRLRGLLRRVHGEPAEATRAVGATETGS
jgi:hypothetical protein